MHIDRTPHVRRALRRSGRAAVWAAGLAAACVGAAQSGEAQAAPADECARLKDLPVAGMRITAAALEPAGPFSAPAGGPGPAQTLELPARCRVQGVLEPTPDSEIGFEAWMPATGWNGRFQGVGNGGFAGDIGLLGLANAVRAGYAAASTDTGHKAGGTDARWAFGHPEKLADFGWRAIHLTAVAGKQLAAAYYGAPVRWSYFDSCSNGGRQALMEAQRFPEDYDGIIAMAPAYDWTGLFMNFIWDQKVLSAPGAAIPAAKTQAIAAAVLAACDTLDGVADGLIADPRACRFDPARLRCAGEETNSCLTDPQIAALRAIYRGPHASDGKRIYFGFVPGGESAPGSPGWDAWIFGPRPDASIQSAFGTGFMKYMAGEGDSWTPSSFDFDRDAGPLVAKVGPVLNAKDPNLEPFAARGGKLILVHGWSDAAIPARGTVAYYDSVRREMGLGADRFVRLYLVPGMHHCGGGTGPSDLGGAGVPRLPRDPRTDLSAALEAWVEQARAPGAVVAREPALPGAEAMSGRTALICPYPETAALNPGRNMMRAESYVCVRPAARSSAAGRGAASRSG
jgi:feruloyl esterase